MRALCFVVAVAACGSASPPPAAAPVAPPPAAAPPAKPSLDGYWTGVLGGQLHVALDVRGDTAILDSIDQAAKLPVDKLTFDGTNVHFEVARVHGSYDGKLSGDTIDGSWSQGPAQPLKLQRGTRPVAGSEPAAHPPAPIDAPFDVWVPTPPLAMHADGRTNLVYELHIDNFASTPLSIEHIDVMVGPRTLATFDRAALDQMMPGETHAKIAGLHHAVVFMWVAFDGAPPAKIDHVIATKLGDHELTTNAPTVALDTARPRVIASPLKGAKWLAANGPSNTSSHRRALLPIGGHARIAQRFAIDWVQLGDDDKTFTGDPAKNASYHAYGQPVLAVAAGTVVEVKDGIVENVPQQPPAVPITLDTVAGNHIVLDLGGGVFAMYAHVQPGSLKVKVGDKVKLGQPLALLGNSGNSTEPHLHFQLTDAGNPLGAEGIPYALPKFTAHKQGTPPTPHANEMPSEDESVDF